MGHLKAVGQEFELYLKSNVQPLKVCNTGEMSSQFCFERSF